MGKIENILFYTMDKSIRTYRQFAQKQLKNAGFSITIDQWLLLKNIEEEPALNQQDLGKKVFKDNASVTRIISMLVEQGMVVRNIHKEDRRRTFLLVTKKGRKILNEVQEVILKNRETALKGMKEQELVVLKRSLQKIIDNVNKKDL